MKDYTKYDFGAIVGAKVSILLKSKIEYGGTLILVDKKNGAIFLLMNDNPLALEGRWFSMEEITSLTAGIKVEDMTLKQLRARRNLFCFLFGSDFAQEMVAKGNLDVLHGYVECTDWGW